MASAAERVFLLIRETVEAQGVSLWDVRFVKEGASWYLRVYIDKPEGISIDDCTNVSHAIDPVIDQADPIDKSYYLEVCSPGIERELTRPEHFKKCIGQTVKVRLYKAQDGVKDFTGILEDGDQVSVTVSTDGGRRVFEQKEISKIYISDFE